VVVIRHWKIHNYIQNDRFKPTVYVEEKAQLSKGSDNAYQVDTNCIQNVSSLDTQVRLGKDRDRIELGKDNMEEAQPPKTPRHKYGMYENVLLTDEEYEKLTEEFPHDYTARIERLSEYIASTGKKYKSHLATIRSWARMDTTQRTPAAKSSNPFLDMLEDGSYE
jgi:hypothetical protein